MAETKNLQDTEYSLADAAILSEPWGSSATIPDTLARSEVAATAPVYALKQWRWVIRSRRLPGPIVILAEGPMPNSFSKSIEKLEELVDLPEGWNSYSAKPVSPENAISAIRLLANLLDTETPAPTMVPTVRGGIQLEWHTNGVDIEVYIEPSEGVSFFAEASGSDESTEAPLKGHERELSLWLRRVSER